MANDRGARAVVAEAVRERGAPWVARKLGRSREAVLRYAGGFATQEGTDLLIEQKVHLLRAER